MAVEGVVIPLWGKLIMLSAAKKGLILTAGYLYGVPKLYRRSQKLIKYVASDRATQGTVRGYVRTAFRLPAKLLHLKPKQPTTPALQYLSMLPSRLLPSQQQPRPPPSTVSKPLQAYRQLKTTFAGSALVQRHSASVAAGRAKLTSLRERFGGSDVLQEMVASRSQHAALLWGRIKLQPYNLVPAI